MAHVRFLGITFCPEILIAPISVYGLMVRVFGDVERVGGFLKERLPLRPEVGVIRAWLQPNPDLLRTSLPWHHSRLRLLFVWLRISSALDGDA